MGAASYQEDFLPVNFIPGREHHSAAVAFSAQPDVESWASMRRPIRFKHIHH
jgi:hypothetical protein